MDGGKSFVGASQRAARWMRIARRAFWAVSLGLLALAIALVRVAPIASVALAAAFTGAFAISWFAQRGQERLVAAADRADLEGLRASATRRGFEYAALVAIAVFDGPAAVEGMDHVMCECGRPECLAQALQSDLASILAALRKVDAGGTWTQAAKALVGEEIEPEQNTLGAATNAARVQIRLAVVQYIMFRSDRIRVPPKTVANPLRGVTGLGSVLRGPIRFAAALNAKTRGDLAEARAQLAQLAPWKPGSRLARQRDELARALESS